MACRTPRANKVRSAASDTFQITMIPRIVLPQTQTRERRPQRVVRLLFMCARHHESPVAVFKTGQRRTQMVLLKTYHGHLVVNKPPPEKRRDARKKKLAVPLAHAYRIFFQGARRSSQGCGSLIAPIQNGSCSPQDWVASVPAIGKQRPENLSQANEVRILRGMQRARICGGLQITILVFKGRARPSYKGLA